ncbi:MAG: hypothetical protein GY715_12210 [Planctomycetes bacterium]|nr:hypothetical protein [Planctomycetota bacterium]
MGPLTAQLASATTLKTPRTVAAPWREAADLARRDREPIFIPVTPHVDDRGWSLMNLLAGAMSERGQINYSVQHPGVVKAWHRHDRQTDFWCCVHGHLKVGVHREEDEQSWQLVIGEQRPGVVVIPPPLWHGAATVGAEPAGLLYYVTERYDPDAPDEHRRPHGSVAGFPWRTRHR